MEIKPPIWYSKKGKCPICDGQGRLEFSSCPECKTVVLICEEEGTVFNDLRSPTLNNVIGNIFYDENTFCPNCNYTNLQDFENATWEEIQKSGFTVGEYI